MSLPIIKKVPLKADMLIDDFVCGPNTGIIPNINPVAPYPNYGDNFPGSINFSKHYKTYYGTEEDTGQISSDGIN